MIVNAVTETPGWRHEPSFPGTTIRGHKERFTPTLSSLLREAIQNALDQAQGPAGNVYIRLHRLTGTKKTDFVTQWSLQERCAHVLANLPQIGNATERARMLRETTAILDESPMYILVVSDRNGRGLTGSISDATSNLRRALYQRAFQNHTDNRGGSHNEGLDAFREISGPRVLSVVSYDVDGKSLMIQTADSLDRWMGEHTGHSDFGVLGEMSMAGETRPVILPIYENGALAVRSTLESDLEIPSGAGVDWIIYNPDFEDLLKAEFENDFCQRSLDCVSRYWWHNLHAGTLVGNVGLFHDGVKQQMSELIMQKDEYVFVQLLQATPDVREKQVLQNVGDVCCANVGWEVPELSEAGVMTPVISNAILAASRADNRAVAPHLKNTVAIIRGRGCVIYHGANVTDKQDQHILVSDPEDGTCLVGLLQIGARGDSTAAGAVAESFARAAEPVQHDSLFSPNNALNVRYPEEPVGPNRRKPSKMLSNFKIFVKQTLAMWAEGFPDDTENVSTTSEYMRRLMRVRRVRDGDADGTKGEANTFGAATVVLDAKFENEVLSTWLEIKRTVGDGPWRVRAWIGLATSTNVKSDNAVTGIALGPCQLTNDHGNPTGQSMSRTEQNGKVTAVEFDVPAHRDTAWLRMSSLPIGPRMPLVQASLIHVCIKAEDLTVNTEETEAVTA